MMNHAAHKISIFNQRINTMVTNVKQSLLKGRKTLPAFFCLLVTAAGLAQAQAIDPIGSTPVHLFPAGAPQTAFVSGTAGDPLPPKNSDAARYWSPELKLMLDEIIKLGSIRVHSPVELDDDILEQKLNIQFEAVLTDPKLLLGSMYMRKVKPKPGLALDAGLLTRYRPKKEGGETSGFSLFLRLNPTEQCINPYDLAIYMGVPMRFIPEPVPDRTDIALPSSFKYEWGMFEGILGADHSRQRFHSVQPEGRSLILSGADGCISSLRLFKTF